MANIELVINMDEYTYNDLKKGKIYSSVRDVPQESVVAIANGTPLPKGQGRLIERLLNDAETLKQELKVGHWVENGTKRNFLDTDIRRGVEMKRYLGKGYHTYINEECSVCRKVTIHDDSIAYAYCPHCGAKMIESQESEAAE